MGIGAIAAGIGGAIVSAKLMRFTAELVRNPHAYKARRAVRKFDAFFIVPDDNAPGAQVGQMVEVELDPQDQFARIVGAARDAQGWEIVPCVPPNRARWTCVRMVDDPKGGFEEWCGRNFDTYAQAEDWAKGGAQ